VETAIITKVKKLIALGTNEGATEGERDNAMRMAHGLLAKHNLSMVDVKDNDVSCVKVENDYYDERWCAIVSNYVAKLFFCFCYSQKSQKTKTKATFCIIGKEANATTAVLITNYVLKSIQKERIKGNYGRSFSNGAAQRIAYRVNEIINKVDESEFSSSQALAVINLHKTEIEEAMDFVKKQCGVSLVAAKRKDTKQNLNEFMAGVNYGNGISLNNQISGNQNIKLN
jgi:hypothetical protein